MRKKIKCFLSKFICSFTLLASPAMVFSSNPIDIKSPSGNIIVSTQLSNQKLFYTVNFNNETIIEESFLGLIFENADSLCYFEFLEKKEKSSDETWKPIWGQFSSIRNNYNELTLFLKDAHKNRRINIQFRVYDDGFAFRYIYPDSISNIVILKEETQFHFTNNNLCWWIWADYNTLEKLYHKTNLKDASHVAAPFTMKTPNGTFVSILEANIDNYSSMTLKQNANDSLSFSVNLVPWADNTAVKTSGPWQSPWRVVQLSTTAGGLIESSILLNLNESSSNQDYSWIQPISYIGIWWEMHLGLSDWSLKNKRHGANTKNVKRTIDFASKHGIKGVLVEGWNTGWEDWGKPDAFDFTTPYPDFDIKEIVRYAKEKNVEIIGHHETGGDIIAYEKNLEKALEFYHNLGIRYVKTGYAGPVNPPTENHHGQYMVNHYNKVMKMALKYNIMLDVHEPIIPSGLSRTYPNLMTFEGVRGMEWNAWSEGNPPSHTCILPFTRGLAGPMDYTPGIFNIKLDKFSNKRVKWNGLDKGNSAVHSTLSNQIALMIVLYSPMQMASDLIENYENHPAFEFVSKIPTTWDETNVLEASIGECIIIARRYGSMWFIAGISNESPRVANISFSFLESGKKHSAFVCKDAPNSTYNINPETYSIETKTLTSNDFMEINMASGGGFVIIIEPF